MTFTTGGVLRLAASFAVAGLSWWNPACAQEEPRQLRVEYAAPRLTVEARNAPLLEVLSAIGAKVGFTVVDAGLPSPPVTLSVTASPPDQVLRRLLSAENHTIVYRRGDGSSEMIDRILLLGGPTPGGAREAMQPGGGVAIAAGRQSPSVMPVGATGEQPVAAVAPVATASGASANAAPGVQPPTSAESEQPTIGDMLRTHALAGARAPEEGTPPPAAQPPLTTEETLAVTTRRAQEGLAALVEGLQAATRAVLQSPPAGQ